MGLLAGSAAMMHASAVLRLGAVTGAITIAVLVGRAVLGAIFVVADAVAIGIMAGLTFNPLLFGQTIAGTSTSAVVWSCQSATSGSQH
jgi:uncharacterized membrane protein YebE (DUF533 family)